MFLPIGDQPNPKGFTPVVNYALLAVNIAVFLLVSLPLTGQPVDLNNPAVEDYVREILRRHPDADLSSIVLALRQTSAYDIFVVEWGYRPAEPSIGTLFTSMFLHGGWMHLIGNMLFLWIYGDNVEHRLGRMGYLLVYLATGIAATLSFAAFVPESSGNVPLVGASGAISGVLGLYFLWFPHNKVRILVVLFPFFMDVWLLGARLVLGFYLVVDNLLPFVLRGAADSGVAHGAHIGGFVAGVAAAYALNQIVAMQSEQRVRHEHEVSPHAERETVVGTRDAHAVVAAHRRGDFEDAALAYLDLSQADRRTIPVAAAADFGDWLAQQGEPDGALAVYRRALNAHPRGPGVDRILLGMGLVLLHRKGRPTSAYQYLLDVLDVEPDPAVEQAARKALAEIEQMQKMAVNPRRWRE